MKSDDDKYERGRMIGMEYNDKITWNSGFCDNIKQNMK
jgi:hypothetical protein